MKLSLRWIFDHLNGFWNDIPLDDIVSAFNKKTAEIEHVEKIICNPDLFTAATVVSIGEKEIRLYSAEHKKEYGLSPRKDALVNSMYILKKEQESFFWATLIDFGSSKEGLFPEVSIADNDISGEWKESLEKEDYIITVDNKSVTHRPDMWGHRGFAREIGAIFHKELKQEELFFTPKTIKHYEKSSKNGQGNSFSLEVEDTKACDRLAGLYISAIKGQASSVAMAVRLARIDSKPIDFIVDCTNYVMFDMSQPIHAFDAAKIKSAEVKVGRASAGQKLTLLDGETINLSADDLVISSGNQPLALAGVMGGIDTAVSKSSTKLYIESAHYDATTIRLQAARHKKRTEASARFEKTLDPNQNTQALLRFLTLLDEASISYTAAENIVSIGQLAKDHEISITHSFIVKRLGLIVVPEAIEKILYALGFGVRVTQEDKEIIYKLVIPTFRSTKDIRIKEDIVEEIGRLVGYEKIPLRLPTRSMEPRSLTEVMLARKIKQELAFGLCMREVQNYAFYNEDLLELIQYNPAHALSLKNPVSDKEKRLVTSLIPHLFKNISQNIPEYETIRFFECNKIWKQSSSFSGSLESRSIAGIFFSRKEELSFYETKALVEQFFRALSLNVLWIKPSQEYFEPWYSAYESAELWLQGKKIGMAGKVPSSLLSCISEGDAFVFECSAESIYQYVAAKKTCTPLQKYQATHLDISILIHQSCTVQTLEKSLSHADTRIKEVQLIDFYQKEGWGDQRSLTFRCLIFDEQKTLTKEEIDQINKHMTESIVVLGGVVR